MSLLTIDFETRSPVDLKKTGVYPYAEHPDTDVWCAAWAIDDGPISVWKPGEDCPEAIFDHVVSGGQIAAWNANFEITIWQHILGPRYGWPVPALDQWRCSMVSAYSMALPGALDNAAGAIGLDIGKDMSGKRLMLTMSKPRRPKKDEPVGKLLWWDDDERKQKLFAYCKTDVEVERGIRNRLVSLRPSEQALWHLDQKINNRGVYVDVELCQRAKAIVEIVTKQLDREMAEVTDWQVTRCSNIGELKTWVRAHGVDTEALDKEALGELLVRNDLDPKVRRALELRQEAGKASVAKIDALLNGLSSDQRARGLLQFHAAATGRWGGRRFQPQNIKRPDMSDDDINAAIDIILAQRPSHAVALIEMLFGPPLSVISDLLRGLIRAPKGKKLVAADFSNIEGRVLAWLAGEEWKLDAFRTYDRGEGPDVYKITAADLLGKLVSEISKLERQALGKVPELASGYQGGHGAYVKMGATGKTLARIVEATKKVTSVGAWADAEARYDGRFGLTKDEWTALRIVIDRWRAKHQMIKQFWRDMEDAAMEAVGNRGQTVRVGKIAFKVVGSFLWMQLPSGRAICMPYPAIVWKEMPWVDDDGKPVKKQVVSFKAVDSVTRQWTTQYAYGGQLTNYATQGTARDIMSEAMPRVEAAGYEVILSVHDELVTEVDQDFGSVEEFEHLMVQLPTWAAGLPVAAEAWRGERYRK